MRKIFSDVGYMGLSQMIVAIAQIALQIYVVRFTTINEYGEYIGSQVVVTLMETIFVARGGELALRYVGVFWSRGDYYAASRYAKKITHIDRYVNWILYFLLVAFALITHQILNLNPYYVIFLALTIPAQIGYGVSKSLFIITSRLQQQSIFEIITAIVQLSAGMVGVYFYGINGLIASVIGAAAVKSLLAKQITNKWWAENPEMISAVDDKDIDIKVWWSESVHSILRNTFFSGSNQIDIILLNAFKSPETVALYKVAKSLSAMPVKISAPVWAALRPRIMSSWHNGDRVKFFRIILVPSLLMLAMLPVMILPVWHHGDELIGRLYGKDYALAKDPFIILLAGVWIFNVATGWYRFWILIIKERLTSTTISALQFFILLVFGLLYGKSSVAHMAEVVCLAMISISLMCWGELIKRSKKL